MKDPEKYGFSPKQLLSQLTDIYLHLSSVELARAVAQDEVWSLYITVYYSISLYHGILQSVIVYHGILQSVIVYHGILQCHSISLYTTVS